MITIVSGLPRSGTSLMMQMLVAGGMPALCDGEREADTDNPRGYLEWERIQQLPNDPGCIAEAEGKVVNVVSQLLLSLPAGHEYRVVLMQRPLSEVIASQDQMLRRRGTYKEADTAMISAAFEKHLREVYAGLDSKTYVKPLRIPYHEVLSQPKQIGKQVSEFLQTDLNVDAMNGCRRRIALSQPLRVAHGLVRAPASAEIDRRRRDPSGCRRQKLSPLTGAPAIRRRMAIRPTCVKASAIGP